MDILDILNASTVIHCQLKVLLGLNLDLYHHMRTEKAYISHEQSDGSCHMIVLESNLKSEIDYNDSIENGHQGESAREAKFS